MFIIVSHKLSQSGTLWGNNEGKLQIAERRLYFKMGCSITLAIAAVFSDIHKIYKINEKVHIKFLSFEKNATR